MLDHVETAHLLGTAYCLLGDIESAKELYQISGDLPYAVLQQAVLANQAGQYVQSYRLLEEAGLSPHEAVLMISGLIEDLPELKMATLPAPINFKVPN